jgi:hypothetical protein
LSIPIELREVFEISTDNDSFADVRGEFQEVLDLRGVKHFDNRSIEGTGYTPEAGYEGSQKSRMKDLVLQRYLHQQTSFDPVIDG